MYTYIYVSYLYSYIDGHLGCFHVLAIVYSAEMNTGVHVFFKLWFIPGLCPAVELLGHMVIPFSFFLRNFHSSLDSGCITLHSHQQGKSFPFSPYPLQHLLFIDIFDDGNSDQCCCSFDFAFL